MTVKVKVSGVTPSVRLNVGADEEPVKLVPGGVLLVRVTKENIIDALGFEPIEELSEEDVVEALGYTPADASLFVEDTTYKGCYYRMVNGEKEWVNPPMVSGVEYRTTERYSDKAVYKKSIDLGALPNAATKTVATGIPGADAFDAQMDFHMAQGQLACFPFVDSSFNVLSRGFLAVNGDFYLGTSIDMSAYTCKVTFSYTKS